MSAFRILSIEDRPETIRGPLADLEDRDCDVVSAPSPSAAVAALRDDNFDLIVTDSVGFPVVASLASGALGPRNQQVPFIVLTGYRDAPASTGITKLDGFLAHIQKGDGVTPLLRSWVERLRASGRRRDTYSLRARAWLIVYTAADAAWASWIESMLSEVGGTVELTDDRGPASPALDAAESSVEVLALLSERALRSPWFHAHTATAIAQGQAITPVLVERSVMVPDSLADRPAINVALVPLSEARARIIGRSQPSYPHPSMEPPSPPRWFTDRAAELALLAQTLGTNADDAPPARVVVSGLAGIGKSGLANAFADRYREQFAKVLWVDATHLRAHNSREIAAPPPDADGRRPLLILDNARDYHAIAATLDENRPLHVLITSREQRWGDPFTVLPLAPLALRAAVDLLRHWIPGARKDKLKLLANALGGRPQDLTRIAELIEQRVASLPTIFEQLDALTYVLPSSAERAHGSYFLGTDDPRAIAAFERALCDVLELGHPEPVELLEPLRGSWKRAFRDRYDPERLQALADKAERAAEVAALSRPESQANRDNAEALARLLEASVAIDNIVLQSGSVLLVKITDEAGTRVFGKTLTATEMRDYEAQGGGLSNPAEALAFLDRLARARRARPALDDPIPPLPPAGKLGL